MAGSSMTFAYDNGQQGQNVGGQGTIKTIRCTWTSDSATGAVSGTTDKISGYLIKGVTDPGSSAPTDNYDINITDEDSVDVLAGCKVSLINRDTANTEEVYFMELNADTTALSMAIPPVVCSKLTVAVTNAGNSHNGVIVLYYRN